MLFRSSRFSHLINLFFSVYQFDKRTGPLIPITHFKPILLGGIYLSVCVNRSEHYQHFIIFMFYSEKGYIFNYKKSGYIYLPEDKFKIFEKIIIELLKENIDEKKYNSLIDEIVIKINESNNSPICI